MTLYKWIHPQGNAPKLLLVDKGHVVYARPKDDFFLGKVVRTIKEYGYRPCPDKAMLHELVSEYAAKMA